jgi:hypothetical protein
MADSEWGLCKDCKWWQIEPKAAVENLTMGLCIDEKLQPFLLRVSGNSGCNLFMPGKPARAKGSSEAPPSAEPVRSGRQESVFLALSARATSPR